MIRVSKLTKDYGFRRAIDELDFSIEKGEVVAFLGPNGAGKTTTMRILAGYMPPTTGSVEIGGYDIMEQSMNVRRIVGYLPESVPLYPDMTVFEYLMFMASLRNVANAEDRVDEVLEMVHLENRSEGYISNLSKGMRQRVGLAQALVHKPDVLILDEPTIGLDPAQIIEVRNLIREIGQEHTVLLSTHILPEAQQVCDRVIIINKGKVVAEDSTESLQARLEGGQRINLRIRESVEPAIPLIQSLDGVMSLSVKDRENLEIETQPGIDIRPAIARTVVGAGLDLLDLHQSTMSLEDIFLELTQEENIVEENAPNGEDRPSVDQVLEK